MAKFTMLVGPSGSGKSSYAKKLRALDPANTVVVSSNTMRKELSENFKDGWSDQTRVDNQTLFEAMTDRSAAYLRQGKNVVFDGMSMRRKYRVAVLRKLPADAEKYATVMCKRVEDLLEQNSVKYIPNGHDIVLSQLAGFQPPCHAEGFDEVDTYTEDGAYLMHELAAMMKEMPYADDPGHTVYDHCHDLLRMAADEHASTLVINACLWHECGRPLLRKCDVNGVIHDRGYAGIGAYALLSAGCSKIIPLAIAEHARDYKGGLNPQKLHGHIGGFAADCCIKLMRLHERLDGKEENA